MRTLAALTGVLGILGVRPAAARQKDGVGAAHTTVLKVSGMHCGACAARVETAAKKIDGLTAAHVSQPQGAAEIAYDPAKVTPEAVATIIGKRTGFDATAPQPKTPDHES